MSEPAPPPRPGTAPPGARLYAIGDVHGQLALLEALHEVIREDLAAGAPARVVVVYVGDYVDRGGESRAVLDLLATDGRDAFGQEVECVHLLGNHEDMMLQALDPAQAGTGYGDGMMASWLRNGGLATVASYGVMPDTALPFPGMAARIRQGMAEALPASHRALLDRLVLQHREGGYLFVHAGIRPGVPFERQSRDDLLWIREEFLEDRTAHPAVIVHGHTPTRTAELLDNRIGIDTGAFATGRLTAVALEGTERRVLQVTGSPA